MRYLVGVLKVPETAARAFDIGGPDVLAYEDIMRRVADIEGRPMLVVPVPLLSPQLSLVRKMSTALAQSTLESWQSVVVTQCSRLAPPRESWYS